MGQIQLTRIDDRLVHGQVMTKWSKGLGINAIFIIDTEVAKDDFMKQIFISSGEHSGFKVKVMSIDEVIEYWNTTQFENYKAILLFKSVFTVSEAVKKGLPATLVNIGGIAKRKDTKFIINSVSIGNDEAELLRELNKEYNVEIFFQMLPDSNKVSLAEALKQF
jgi:PTS system mannose-specific IIB component